MLGFQVGPLIDRIQRAGTSLKINAAGDAVLSAGKFIMSAAASKIVPGATSWAVRNNADNANNILIIDDGTTTLRKYGAGIAHFDSSGNVSSSAIVSADITDGTIVDADIAAAAAIAGSKLAPSSGTWTPTLYGASTAGTNTYSHQAGFYWQIGKLTVATCQITLTALGGTTAGEMRISLPFTSANVSDQTFIAAPFYNAINLDAGYTDLALQNLPNTNYVRFLEQGDNIGAAALLAANFGNTSIVQFTLVFMAA